jgi:branched-chain amino acid transport system permease protein
MPKEKTRLFLPTITVLFLLFLVCVPLFSGRFYIKMFEETLILALWAISWNFMFAYTGMLSFGHAGFFAIGAYACGMILNLNWAPDLSMLVALIGAGVVSGLLALIIGYICTRSTEIYFSIVTLLFSMVIYSILYQWRSFTGGDDGLSISNDRFLFGIDLSKDTAHYYWVLTIVAISIALMWIFTRSYFGYAVRSIKENPERAEFLGLPVRTYRLGSFVIGGTFGGISGALIATMIGHVNPGLAYWAKSAEPILISLIGGLGYFFGPLIGAGIYLFLMEAIMARMEYWRFALGIFFIVIVIFASRGILGFYEFYRKKSENR